MVRARRGWIGESGRHSLAARGVHSRPAPRKSSYYDVPGTQKEMSQRTLAELKKMEDFFYSISKEKEGERVVTLYRGTDPREAKEVQDYAKRGQPYTMYGKWWSTDPEEAKKYALEKQHFDASGKWALLAREVKLSDLKSGELLPHLTVWDEFLGFRAKYRDEANEFHRNTYEVYIERQPKQKYSGYIVFFHGGKPIDAKTIQVLSVGEV